MSEKSSGGSDDDHEDNNNNDESLMCKGPVMEEEDEEEGKGERNRKRGEKAPRKESKGNLRTESSTPIEWPLVSQSVTLLM